MRRLVSALGALALLLGGVNHARAERYTLTDLNVFGGPFSEATDINDSGQVVGGAYVPKGPSHPFLYSNGKVTDLLGLGPRQGIATGISNSGYIIGWQGGAASSSGGVLQNWIIDGGGFSGFSLNQASLEGISKAGIVGADGGQAFLDRGMGFEYLGTLGGRASHAIGINDSGQVVGYSEVIAGKTDRHAFLWQNGKMSDLGTLGGPWSDAQAINNAGHIVGTSAVKGIQEVHAFLYKDGKMIDLGTLGGVHSWGYGINDAGQIVGKALAEGDFHYHAFLYENGKMIDLNSLITPESHLKLLEATAINNKGQIVGMGRTADGEQHAFLLTPVSEVPEPGSLALLGMGAASLAGYAWRQRRRLTRSAPSA